MAGPSPNPSRPRPSPFHFSLWPIQHPGQVQQGRAAAYHAMTILTVADYLAIRTQHSLLQRNQVTRNNHPNGGRHGALLTLAAGNCNCPSIYNPLPPALTPTPSLDTTVRRGVGPHPCAADERSCSFFRKTYAGLPSAHRFALHVYKSCFWATASRPKPPALDRRSCRMISIKGFSQSGDRFSVFTPALISRERVLDFSLEPHCMRRNVWT